MSEAKRITTPCPKCGGELVVRKVKQTGTEFLGCERWPKCSFTEPMPAYFEMLRAGAVPLPGFGGEQ